MAVSLIPLASAITGRCLMLMLITEEVCCKWLVQQKPTHLL